ncbi:MAG: phosphoglycerate kinase [Acidimicrobiales bacterium]
MIGRLPLLEDLGELRSKRVLVRLDLNVPLGLDAAGRRVVTDDFRIRAALPTLTWLLNKGAKVTACTHLGRPAGAPDPRYDVEPVRELLSEMVPGVRLLENLRFSPGEKNNDPAFVAELVEGQDCFVNDAFGVCHRSDASVVGPPKLLPSAAGRLVQREVEQLGSLLDEPARPFVVIIGGAKVADKLGLLASLARLADRLLIGGAMAFSFTRALGQSSGESLVDVSKIEACGALLRGSDNIVLPVDFIAAAPGLVLQTDDWSAQPDDGGETGVLLPKPGEVEIVGQSIPDGWTGYDIGPATAEAFRQVIAGAATLLWNGPMGVFEDRRFDGGTRVVAQAVADCAGRTVIGGGDSVAAVHHYGLADRIDHISTGGGASLELLEHGDLPGLRALRESVGWKATAEGDRPAGGDDAR